MVSHGCNCRRGLEYDFVKVLDFGLVQVTGPNPAHDPMAPETIVGSGKVDHRAHIYALGCAAYYLLTRQQVFQGGTQMQALVDHVSTAFRPPSALAPAPVPRALDGAGARVSREGPGAPAARRAHGGAAPFGCPGARDWSTAQAALWWQAHLPDLSARLAPATDAATRSVTAARDDAAASLRCGAIGTQLTPYRSVSLPRCTCSGAPRPAGGWSGPSPRPSAAIAPRPTPHAPACARRSSAVWTW